MVPKILGLTITPPAIIKYLAHLIKVNMLNNTVSFNTWVLRAVCMDHRTGRMLKRRKDGNGG